ncbi:MAG: hypothetical protein PVH29_06945 [Candidatus Zixiibacteriota bacterium]|jgi:hypothetical protein
MADYDTEQVHKDTIEYYRLTLAQHEKDPHAVETAKADRAVLEMVRETPGVVEMNSKMMEGGLAFAVARAMSVDGANFQADVYEELEEGPLAERWRARAGALAASGDMNELYAISEKMDAEEAPTKENESRAKSLIPTIIEKLLLVEASPPGTGLDEQPMTTLTASLDELAQRFPGVRFPDALDLPRFRTRLVYSDGQIKRLVELFEKVNAERLGGRY